MLKKLLILAFAVLSINSLQAHNPGRKIEIKGKVLDVYNAPIANAIIMVDNQKTNVLTDAKGNYKIKVRQGASKIGIFTFGNGLFEQSIDGRNRVDFKFSTIASQQYDPGFMDGEQAVSNGYGVVKKKNLVTDISRIDGSKEKYSTYSSIYEMLQRDVSGVEVMGREVVIQGSRNFDGYVHPLIVVDGVYMTHLPNIPPVTVQSIEVLKSTAASIYGSRAIGGAIIIKTKMGGGSN